MKKYLFILLIFPFVLKAPIMEPSVVLSELYFDTNGEWVIELQHLDALDWAPIDSVWLKSTSGISKLRRFDPSDSTGIIIVRKDSLLSDLELNPRKDSIEVLYYSPILAPYAQSRYPVIYGYENASIACPTIGQSIAGLYPYFYFYFLDQSPTIGAINDTIGISGILKGKIYDNNNNLLTGLPDNTFTMMLKDIAGTPTGLPITISLDGSYTATMYAINTTINRLFYRYGERQGYFVRINPMPVSMQPDSVINMDIHIIDSLISGISNKDYYYWEYHQKKELTLLPSYVQFVTYDLEMDTTDLKELLGIPGIQIIFSGRSYHINAYHREIQEYNYALLEDSLLINTDLTVYPEISYVSKNLCLDSDGKERIVSDLFYVYIEDADSMDLHLLDSMALANRVDYLGVRLYSPAFYNLRCTKESAGDALEMANLFYESGFFTNACADLMLVRWESSLETPSAEKVNICTSAGELIVVPPAGARLLELYSVQGIKLGSYVLNEGKTFRLALPPGMYLYKIYAGKNYSGKVLLP